MRIGTTSYIYPAGILENVARLAGQVQDIELLVFESPLPGEDYPDEETVRCLKEIAQAHDLSYTVHLPMELRLATDDPELEAARSVIRVTEPLEPAGFIIHLEADPGGDTYWSDRWVGNSLKSLNALAKGREQLLEKFCVENVEDQPPETLNCILDRMPVSCCVDVGHIWKQSLDPLPWVESLLPRMRVMHLHGVDGEMHRDHKGLSLVPPERLDPLVALLTKRFHGVLTFEVFSEKHLNDCISTFRQSANRLRKAGLASGKPMS